MDAILVADDEPGIQGAMDYVPKPVIFDDVLGKIARALEHRQAVWEAQQLRHETEEGKMPITIEPVVVAELVDEVLPEHRALAAQAGRTIDVDVTAALPAVAADRALLRRVLANLIGNAVRHSGSSVIHVVARSDPDRATVLLAVRDRGRGIPAAHQERIFEKFASVRRSPSDEPFRDTGLGLPFCKLAVDQMGGSLLLDSAPGMGSVFTVMLPMYCRG